MKFRAVQEAHAGQALTGDHCLGMAARRYDDRAISRQKVGGVLIQTARIWVFPGLR
jgi:hypothetical protein